MSWSLTPSWCPIGVISRTVVGSVPSMTVVVVAQRRVVSAVLAALAVVASTVAPGPTSPVAASASETDPVPFIIGGSDTPNPGYVAVLLRPFLSDPEAANFCGGSLIRVDVVMTAAHCVDDLDPNDVEVAVGFTLLSSISAADRLEVDEIAIHPDWVLDEVLPTDIALLRLKDPTTGRPVVPIEQDPEQPVLLRPLRIIGWGYADPDRTVSLDALQSAGSLTLTLVDHDPAVANSLCLLVDPGDDFCHGTAVTGSCQGDSGSPVLAETSASPVGYEVVGMVSFGPSSQCLHPTIYDGAQRISPYLSWIEDTLESWNEAPQVSAGQPTVSVLEGDIATNSGQFDDRENHPVTVTASVGTIVQDSGGSGVWSWEYQTSDGPADSRTVTVTASDGTTNSTTFDLTVENVAPVVAAGPDQTVRAGAGNEIEVASYIDPGEGDTHSATVDWGNGSAVAPATAAGGSVTAAQPYTEPGRQVAAACVVDADGAEHCDTLALLVIADLVCPDPVLPFGDVSALSFALADIGCIFGLGITTGTSATTFDPLGSVTREQMAAFLARLWRALGLVCPDPVLPFGDVSALSFALADIGCIFGLGITTGTSATTFDPLGSVTREQMAAFLARLWRALGLVCPDPVLPFGDVSALSFALADIGCIFGLGITTGTSATTFDPLGSVTREQLAAFIARFLRALQTI